MDLCYINLYALLNINKNNFDDLRFFSSINAPGAYDTRT